LVFFGSSFFALFFLERERNNGDERLQRETYSRG
jgi:hypothetical protein